LGKLRYLNNIYNMKHLIKFNEEIEKPSLEETNIDINSQIEWVQASDRYILIQKDENGEVVGLNYMQGKELELFKEEYSELDEELTYFYIRSKDLIKGDTELEVIDNAIWCFFYAK